MANLAGKIAWITGAGSGIGEAAAVALAGDGATVILTAPSSVGTLTWRNAAPASRSGTFLSKSSSSTTDTVSCNTKLQRARFTCAMLRARLPTPAAGAAC